VRIVKQRDGFGTVVRNLAKGDAVYLHVGEILWGSVIIVNTTKGRTRVAFQFHKDVGINQAETPCKKKAHSASTTNVSSHPCSHSLPPSTAPQSPPQSRGCCNERRVRNKKPASAATAVRPV
jgi:hypothetical protein